MCNKVSVFRRALLSSFRIRSAFHPQLLLEAVCSYNQELQMTECLPGALGTKLLRLLASAHLYLCFFKMIVGFRKGDINAVK